MSQVGRDAMFKEGMNSNDRLVWTVATSEPDRHELQDACHRLVKRDSSKWQDGADQIATELPDIANSDELGR